MKTTFKTFNYFISNATENVLHDVAMLLLYYYLVYICMSKK